MKNPMARFHTDDAEDTERGRMHDVRGRIVDSAFWVHKELGPGLLKSVYEVIFADRLTGLGLHVEHQCAIPIRFGGKIFEEGFRADLIVNSLIIVEIKSVEQLARLHKKQLLTYLGLSDFSLGLLINFGGELLKGNIERIVVGKVPDLKISPESTV